MNQTIKKIIEIMTAEEDPEREFFPGVCCTESQTLNSERVIPTWLYPTAPDDVHGSLQ